MRMDRRGEMAIPFSLELVNRQISRARPRVDSQRTNLFDGVERVEQEVPLNASGREGKNYKSSARKDPDSPRFVFTHVGPRNADNSMDSRMYENG